MPQFTEIADRLATLEIEVPSWAYGNSGTRFKVFAQVGTPRTVQEKIADAAQVQKASGLAPAVALHIPWDKVDDYDALNAFAADHGVRIGTVNSNTFQDEDFKLGSLCNPSASVRKKAVQHNLARLAGEVAVAIAASGSAADAIAAAATFDDAIFLEVAAAKIRVGEAATEGAGIAHQVLGAIGFTKEHTLHRFTRRLWAGRDDGGV